MIMGDTNVWEPWQFAAADVNQDGEINVIDILNIVDQILGITPQQQSQIMDEVRRMLQTETQQTPIRPGDSVRDINPT